MALPLEIMTTEIIPFIRDSEAEPAPAQTHDSATVPPAPPLPAPCGLANPMYQTRGRNQGMARWLVLAVLTGTVAALAFVNLLAG